MTKFIYNNTKNANTSHTLFDLNCEYYPHFCYKKDIDSHFKSKSIKLSMQFKKLITIYKEKLYYA